MNNNKIRGPLIRDSYKDNISPGDILSTNNYGQVEIIQEMPKINNRRRVLVKFLNTNHIQEVSWQELKRGKIKDESTVRALNFDSNHIYQTNDGPAIILKDLGEIKRNRWVRIRFINTGCERDVVYQTFLKGQTKDFLKPSVYNIGYIGRPEKVKGGTIEKILYNRWLTMLSRCYNINDISYCRYGAVGITVHPSWFNLSQYLNDVVTLPGFDLFINNPQMYQLDKDYLQMHIPKNIRFYSANTCIWLNRNSNVGLTFASNDFLSYRFSCITSYNGIHFSSKIYNPTTAELFDSPIFRTDEAASSFHYYNSIPWIVSKSIYPMNILPQNELVNYEMKIMCRII